MQRTALILACLIFCVNSFTQTGVNTSHHNFKHINVQNGLVQNIVYHFLEDSRGYMWFGTHNGITLHDGNKALNFLHDPQVKSSIAGTFITSIREDSAQQVWIGNEKGIDRFDRSSLSFRHFGIDRGDGIKVNTYCVALGFVKSDELWLLDTEKKAVRSLNTKTGATRFIAEFHAEHSQFYKDPHDQKVHLWSCYDKGTIHQVYQNDKLLSEESFFDGKNKTQAEPELIVIHVLQQNDSLAWLSTNKGLVRLNPLTKKYQLFNSWQGQLVNELRYSTLADDDDHLWVGSGPDGIYKFNTQTNRFLNNFRNNKFDASTICSDNIVSLYTDRMGNLWCGSFGNGLSYTNTRSSFFSSHISKKETSGWGGNNYVSLLGSTPQGNLWCTFQNIIGIGLLDKDFRIQRYGAPIREDGTFYNDPIYKLLFETNDEAWLASSKGLFLYNLKTNKIRSIKYPLVNDEVLGSIWIKDMTRLHDSSILFSTYQSLYHLKLNEGKPTIEPVSFLKAGEYNGFGKLATDKQGLIYAKSLTDYIYILRYSPSKGKFELIKTIAFMPEVNQFFNYEDDSLMYIAGDNGLYSINTNHFSITKEKLTERLPFTSISSIFRKDDKFWLFGEKGLYCYDKKKKESKTFTMEDGLPANDFTISSFVYDNTSRCIAGTSNGLVSFYPTGVQFITNTPRVRLKAFYINDRLDTLNANPDEIKNIRLSSKQNTFSFDFASLSFFHNDNSNFEYKLEAYDNDWIRSGTSQYTRYSKIPPGKYLFMLRVLDNEGNLSPYSKTVEIEIAKSFWQTTFFRISLFVVLFFAGSLFLKLYSNEKIKNQKRELEKIKAIEKERTRIATDMHDDLGAGLSRIKFLSETIGIKKQQSESFDDDIGKIRQYSHEMIDKMGEIVWALNEKNDTLSDLLSYTRSYAVEYLAQNGISCVVKAPEYFPTTFVSGEFRRNIYLTVKEALHNIVKHAQASSVTIKMGISKNLQLEIYDNGKGFDKNKVRSFSNGLSNMEARINKIRGKFEILNGAGTTIKMDIPLPS